MPTSLLRAACVAVLVLGTVARCPAQTYTWDGGGTSNNWNDAINWAGNASPLSSPSNAIVLDGTTRTTTVQNAAATFQLNSLAMNANTATNGFVVNPFNGSQLQFVGATPAIAYTGGGNTIAAALVVNTDIDFGTSTATLAINGSSGTGTFYEMIIGGRLSGTGTITRTNSAGLPSDLVLAGVGGAFAGTFDNGGGGGGITVLAGANVFGRAATLNTGTFLLGVVNTSVSGASTQAGFNTPAAYNQQFGTLVGTGMLQLGNATAGSTVLVGFNQTLSTDAMTFAGQLNAPTVTGGGPVAHFAKVGAGTLTLTALSSGFTGQFSVRDGSVVLSGSGNLGSTAASPTTALSVTVAAGGELRTVTGTSSNGRLQNNAAVALNGGTLRLDASGFTASGGYSDDIGALTVGPGQSTVRVDPSATRAALFNFASLAYGGTAGTVLFQANNLGTTTLAAGANVGNVAFATAPTTLLVGGTSTYAAGTTDLSILPFAFAAVSGTGAPATLVTYDSVNASVRGLADTNYSAAFSTATDNVSLSAAASLAAPATANSLRTTGTGAYTLALGANPLTLTAGALLDTNTGGTTVTGTGAGILTFGAGGSSTAYVTTTNVLNLQAPVSAANFAKSGAGVVNVSGMVALGGNATVAVNAGTLALQPGGGFAAAGGPLTYQVARGATLDVKLNPLTLAAGQILRGNGAVSGPLTFAAGSTLDPNSLFGPGTLTVGAVTLNGGSTLRIAVSSGVTEPNKDSLYTASKVFSTGTLDMSGASAANRVTLAVVSLGANNAAGAVYDLVPGESYTWRVAEFTGGITGFDPAKFAVDATNFSGAGAFTVSVSNEATPQSLYLTYAAPVPEPSTVLGLAAFALAGVRAARHKLRAVKRLTRQVKRMADSGAVP